MLDAGENAHRVACDDSPASGIPHPVFAYDEMALQKIGSSDLLRCEHAYS
jgi:hypothetical protein